MNLTVTSYLIFQGLAPSLWGPISDVKGRRVAYFFTFLVFIGACIGLANTKNYATLVILRCLQSTGSASTIAIGSGVIGDITTRAERGGFMGIFQAGLLVPLGFGPVIGSALAETLGWRAIFWVLTGYSIFFITVMLIFLPETLRLLVANGSRVPNSLLKYPLVIYQTSTKVSWDSKELIPTAPKKHINLIGPLQILVSKSAAPIIFFIAIYYSTWQMCITSMSSLFEKKYTLTEFQVGLTFIANGVGSMIGTLATGRILDLDYQKVKTAYEAQTDHAEVCGESKENEFPLEKARLRLVPIFACLQCLSLIVFGWTIQHEVHISVPVITTFFTGLSAVSMQSTIMTYLIDIFQEKSAAASASINLARCLFAAGGTSFVAPLMNAVGAGVTFTCCAAVQLVSSIGLFIQWKCAPSWRKAAKEEQSEDQK